jgi:hypothetical protein
LTAVALQDVTGRFLDPAVASAEGIKLLRATTLTSAQFTEQDLGQGRLLSRTEGRAINAQVYGGKYNKRYIPYSQTAGI